jgi:hypothetical protein
MLLAVRPTLRGIHMLELDTTYRKTRPCGLDIAPYMLTGLTGMATIGSAGMPPYMDRSLQLVSGSKIISGMVKQN